MKKSRDMPATWSLKSRTDWSALLGVVRRVGSFVPAHLLLLFVALDAAFVVLHFGQQRWWPADPNYSVGQDGGYAEIYQYVKTATVAVCLAYLSTQATQRLLRLWSALFAYVVADDALRLHESVGIWLTDQTPLLRALHEAHGHALGELILFALVGAAFLLAGWRAVHRGARWTRTCSELALLFTPLVAFGVGLDFVHSMTQPNGIAFLGLLEDAGEMLATSVIAAYALGQLHQPVVMAA